MYGYYSMMHIGAKARVVFMHNAAYYGGVVFMSHGLITIGNESYGAKVRAVFMNNNTTDVNDGAETMLGRMITVGAESYDIVIFAYNHATRGGAIRLSSATLIVDSEANLIFSNNSGMLGGALQLMNSTVHVNTSGVEFYNNRVSYAGGAIHSSYGTMIINTNKSANFTMNSAQLKGGAIYIQYGAHPFIIISNYSKLLLFNNSAFQGGALYSIMPSLLMITVGYQSSIQFINNTAFDVGGAVYSQSSYPCIFMITDYSAKISFTGNYAQRGVGHHMYGASVRDTSCSAQFIELLNEQGKPHCLFPSENSYHELNISFDPDLNETLSPVSSAPQRVCLCDSNGKPQCANISYIFTDISVYRGETITLSTCIVGYDFGTTVGTIHARSLYSDSKQDKL